MSKYISLIVLVVAISMTKSGISWATKNGLTDLDPITGTFYSLTVGILLACYVEIVAISTKIGK